MKTIKLVLTVSYDSDFYEYAQKDYESMLYDSMVRMIGQGGLTGCFYDAEVENWSITFEEEEEEK